MLLKRFSKFLLVVLALALWASTAMAQVTVSAPTAFAYTKGAAGNTPQQTLTVGDVNGANNFSAVITPVSGGNWLLMTAAIGTTAPATTATSGITPDAIFGISVDPTVAAGLAAGPYTATLTITGIAGAGTDTTVVPITVTLNVSAPITATVPTSTSLISELGYASAQPNSIATVTINNSDAAPDNYTFTASNCPAWMTATPSSTGVTTAANAGGTGHATHAAPDTLTFKVDYTILGVIEAPIANCQYTIKYLLTALTANSAVSFTNLAIVTAPLVPTPAAAPLVYNRGTSTATTASVIVYFKPATGVPSGTLFNVDGATVPPWATPSPLTATNPVAAVTAGSGTAVTYTMNQTVAASMPVGNYTANVGYWVTGFPEQSVPVSIQITNSSPAMTESPAAQVNVAYSSSLGAQTPTATLFSTNEPQAYTATCTVTLSPATITLTSGNLIPCSLNGVTGLTTAAGVGNVANGTAFTWGSTVTATLDPLLLNSQIGNVLTVTITFGGTPNDVVYQYTIVPGTPTIYTNANPIATGGPGLVPTSVSANLSRSNDLVVLVKGTNFVGPGQIATSNVGNPLAPTQVWLGNTLLTSINQNSVGSYVVLPPNANLVPPTTTEMLITIKGAVFPTGATIGHPASLNISIANQTGLTAPTLIAQAQAATTLSFTDSAVVYGITSTASYSQPALGLSPSIAPYELVSIWGDNFTTAPTGPLPNGATNSAAFDAFGKIVVPMMVTPAVGTTVKATTLQVVFKDALGHNPYNAPVLFANNNQINAIVPSSVVLNAAQFVTVTPAAGTAAVSDGLYAVNIVAADPSVFTLATDGTGQAAIVNIPASGDWTINGAAPAAVSSTISIYLTGLGIPDSIGVDLAPQSAVPAPGNCVEVSNTTAGSPGLVQAVNATAAGYTIPSPKWTTIDGALMTYDAHHIVQGAAGSGFANLPPCMATDMSSNYITVKLGTAANNIPLTGAAITYAGFAPGSIAGLYQINVTMPASFAGTAGTASGATLTGGAVPIQVTIATGSATYRTQPGTTITLP